MKKIAIGTDHRGFAHKEYVLKNLTNIAWVDVGAFSGERSDYPIFADQAVNLILTNTVSAAVLLCGSGSGMTIAANRHRGIYAAVAWLPEIARAVKEDDNANILVIPADYVTAQQTETIVQSWLTATFKNGRYRERLQMID